MLVKTAIAGASPNWGRVMSAVGAAHAKVKPHRVDVYFDNFLVVKGGLGVDAAEEKLGEVLKQDEVKITIDLHQGKDKATFWGCDLTEKYVKINKRYV
jgi:glutamate N-acetyltransferase/amino-acid N-acetyltransferase